MQDFTLIEGWRAVFNTVLRYGISERSSMFRMSSEINGRADPVTAEIEQDSSDAMREVIELVENVKQHGVCKFLSRFFMLNTCLMQGKQLLAYVRSLLG
jgi:hypothetical protein